MENQDQWNQKKKEHEDAMKAAGLDLDTIIQLRRHIHQNAEGGFKEFNTSKKIYETLKSYGIEEENIHKCAETGMFVDIKGTGEPQQWEDTVNCVALRADIDALPIPENNPDLEYKTQTAHAHMCGHDGHIATLMSSTQVLCKNRHKIPSNKTIRLLWQPAEEGPGGALPMIKQGCLEGVDEVYGYHNWPNFTEGDIRVVEGPIMSQSTLIEIKVLGKGGHGSVPHAIKDVISAGAAIVQNLHTIQSRCIDQSEHFIFTITQFTSGFTYNVFPDDAFLQGSIRSYSTETLKKIKEKITQISENTADAFDCKAEVKFTDYYPAVINHEKETEHVKRLGEKYFGQGKVNKQDLPVTASEDFSFFLQERPGCFYLLGTKQEGKNYILNTSNYDYNESMIGSGSYMFIRIVEDRLGIKIL